MSLMRRSRSGTTVCGLTGIIAFGAAALAPCLREALAGCPETEPVYLGKNDQGDQCTASLRPQTSSGTPASFVLTARSSVDDSAPTDPDASGLPGTVSTSSTKGAGVKTASCSGSKGISGGGGHKDEELIFTFDDAVTADCIVLGLEDIAFSCDDNRPALRADAGQDQTVLPLELVTLDATSGVAPPGATLSYTWAQTSGPSVTLSDIHAAQPTFESPIVAQTTQLEFQVQVSDGTSSSVDSTLITVNAQVPTNSPPFASAGPTQTVEALTPVLLDATGTVDPDGDQLAFQWVQIAGPPVILLDSTTATARFLAPQVEGLTDLAFRVSVSDGQGGSTSTSSVTVSCSTDEPVIFLSSTGSTGYDYTITTSEIQAAFTQTSSYSSSSSSGSSSGTVAFDEFTSIPAGLEIDGFKIRETRGHIYVEFIDCDCPCSTDADCSDGDACNGTELCDPSEGCVPGTPLTCDDGNPCNGTETCNPSTGCVAGTPLPPGTSCDDGDVCNGADTCDAYGQCQAGTPLVCDDGNECNGVETCHPVNGCQPGTPQLCPPVDVVFVMDTSGSMQNEGEALCSTIGSVVADLAILGVTVNDHVLAIHPNYPGDLFSCQSSADTVHALLGDAVPGDPDGCTGDLSGNTSSEKDENWGPATAIVADRYPWSAGAIRVIVPISDEGACLGSSGNGCNNPGSDRDAVDNAVAVAVANNVTVSPITGDGSSACVITLANIMATGTGGTAFNSTDPASDMANAIADLILAACTQADQCDDGNTCTTGDSCVNDICQGTPVDCSYLTDQCHVGVCNADTGLCDAVITAGAACDDGDACTTGDTCDGSGACVGTPRTCNDGNVCTDDSCNPASGCEYVNNTAPCSDGSACTAGDVCSGGVCVSGPPLDCDDADICTDDSCDPGSGCIHTDNNAPCSDGDACTTNDTCSNGLCVGGPPLECNDANVCTDDSCDPSSGCVYTDNAAPCDDSNACTTGDTCSGGACVGGPPLDCNDGNVCTDDSCDPASGCVYVNNNGPCDDGNACTTGDTCSGGACIGGAPLTCSDGNVCTDDSCDPSSGCVYTNNADPCDDGNACTTNDACAGGACVGGVPPDCDDGNVCTDDSCDPASGCQHVNNAAPCNDANACTTGDTCSGGACVGGPPLNCDDGDVCTDDSCDPATGCTNVNNTAACSDGNACTTGDTCSGGACVGGPPLNCDDGNVCTDDSCDPATGCTNVNNTASCSDGNACTTGDTCSGGACVGGPPLNCDDGNVCSDDSCDPASGCVHVNNADACNDGNACTTGDTCSGGACVGGPPPNCSDGNVCTDDSCDPAVGCVHTANTDPCDDAHPCTDADACLNGVCAGTPIPNCIECDFASECDDGNPCTDDDCVGGVCVNSNNADPCDDANACTTNDTCSGGACIGGPPPNCDDANVCTDDSCNPASGCAHTNNSDQCDDGNACTTNDTCSGGACVGGPPPNCDDANVCTDDSCDPASGCVNANNVAPCDDGNACTTNDACTAGACVGGPPPDCDDGNVCTIDSCDPSSGCTHADNTDPCDDGNACTTNDVCAAGACTGGPPLNCDDGNGCTDDSCDPTSGCVHVDNVAPCSDGNECTTLDTCSGGSCVGGPPPDCDDANVCTTDSCSPAVGCLNVDNSDPCDDGNACTTGDTCSAGACVSGPPLDCDDGNGCTDDSCDPSSGCVNVNNSVPCSDGNACTTDDVCSGGVCLGGPPLDCNDGNVCTNDSCDPAFGCVNVDNNAPCSDGNACTTADTCSGGLCIGGPPLNCDDGNGCTDDSCDPTVGCVYVNNSDPCTDGNVCTTDDVCSGGACVGGPPLDCNDANVCTDDSCDPATGCVHVDNTDPCDDANACTTDDLCSGGMCVGGPPLQCNDANPCTDDTCDPGQGCVFTPDDTNSCESDGNLCTIDTCIAGTCVTDNVTCPPDGECITFVCNPVTGECDGQPINEGLACTDDGNECTADVCMFGKCQHPALDDGTACTDDALECTQDVCVDGACSHPDVTDGTPCTDDGFTCTLDVCVEGVCENLALDPACNDDNDCTDDTCDPLTGEPVTGCVIVIDDTNFCSDDDNCTTDACQNGDCIGTPVVCPDNGDLCTDLACDPAGPEGNCNALVNANEGEPCNDGNACNIGERCIDGGCSGGVPVTCPDNGDACTDLACDPAGAEANCSAVVDVNEGGPCEDEPNECTLDTCAEGICTHQDNGLCGACCLPDTSCVDAASGTCEQLGGTPAGLGVACGSDDDGDGVDNLCDQCAGVDDAVFAPGCKAAIPTVSEWGLIVLTLLLLVAGKLFFGGRRIAVGR